MRRPLTQVIARSALAILAILVVALIALHTSPVQSRLLGWSADFLRRTAQIDLAAGQVRLNLFTRRLELTKLRVAAVGHTDNPFFVAEQVSVALPWAAYRGVLAIEDIRLVAGRITITLDADGQSNLPPGGEPADPDAPPFRLDIRNAGIEGLDFEYRDAQGQIAVQMPGIHLSLAYAPEQAAAVGVLAIEQPLEVLVGDREIRVDPVRAGLAFDGSGLRLADLGLRTSEGTFTVSGAIQRALDQPTLDLAITGTADLARAAAWADPPMHVAGEARVTATMKGPPDALAIDAQVRSENLELGRERAMRADVQAAMTPSRLVLPRARLSLTSGAEMRATLDMPLSPDAPLRAEAEWKGLDAPTILRLADQDQRPLGAVSGGTARLERSAAGALTIRLRNTISPRSGPGLVPVAGDLDFSVTGDRWRLTQRHELGGTRVEGTAGGRWETTDVTRSTLDGALTVASDVENALAQAGRLGVEVPTALQNTSGQLDAALTLSGTLGEPRIAGTVNSAGLEIPSVGRVALSATLDASPRLVRANDIDLSLGSTTIRGEVGANLLTRRIDGALTLNAPSAGALLATLVPDTQIDGSVTARATLGGTLDAPDIRAELTGSDLTVAEQVFESLSVRARVLDDGVTIESLGIKQGAGALTATGRYSWNGRYTIDVESQGLTWRGPIAQLGDAEVKVGATFSGSGSLARPVGSGTITFDVGGGLAGDLIRQGTATLRLDGDTARVVGNVPSLGALLTATISPQSPFTYDAVLVVNQLDLAKLAPLAGIAGESLSGAASLSVLAKGALSAPADSTAFVNLQEAKAAVAGVPIALAAPSRLAWDGQALTVDGLEASVGRGRLVATGRLDTGGLSSAQWKTAFDGELEDLVALGRPFGVPAALIAAGPIGLTWHTTGGLDRSTATLVLSGSTVSWEALPSVTDLGLDARFDGSTVTVTRLTGQWQDGKIQGTARVPLAALTSGEDDPALPPDKAGVATIQIAGLSQAALAPWVSPVVLSGIAGRLGATVEARIQRPSVDGVTATLTLDEAAFTLAGVDVAQSRRSQVTFAGGLITATDVAFNAGGSPLTVTGTVRVAPEDQQQLDLTVQGIADLRILSAFAPTVATDGEARFNMGIGGPMSAPVLSGRIDLSGAEAAIREPRLVISDVSGTIALDGSRVVFDRLNGNANGGRVVLDGSFLLDGFTPVEGGLSAVLEQIALDYPMGLQSETTALVTIRPGPSGWSLTGDVRIERSVFNETLSLAAIVAGGGASAPSVAGEESPAEQLRLNLFVSTQQDLSIDNNYGRLEAGTAMRVVGTAANPVLSGRITLREGSEVFLAGNRFRVSRGSISFINPNRIDPEFDIELTTRVSGSEITLTLEGTADRLETDVRSSDPRVDSREAMALLFGGTQADAAALLSAELLGVTGRAVGLDTLRLERGFDADEFRADSLLIATETDPSARLTLSKRVRPDVELIFSQSLRDSGALSAVVSYKPRRNVELRAISRDNLDRSVALRHEITFGGSGDVTAVSDAARPTVTGITFEGDSEWSDEELRALLKLEVGEPFEFHRWQDDLDRLRAAYYERHYYEARVRGLRQVSEDGQSVALEYRITRGPVAELVFEGHPVERALEEEIRDAWTRTIFERFLLEDIRTRVLRHLMEQRYLDSRVDTEVSSTAAGKQIRVTVTAGTLVKARTIAFTGNARIEADRLETVVADAGLSVDGWLDPQRLVDPLVRYYRSQGYLSAAVTAGAPAVKGESGVLPVAIVEGPRFIIGTVSFPGVDASRIQAVTTAARLDTGVPYVTTAVDEARRRVEDLYAREGFNAVSVDIGSEANAEGGSVDVTVTILEGPQQVLREVTTQGATRTQEGVVTRALRLRLGDPVNLGVWSQARKRLYDTNVFRQVDIEAVPMSASPEEAAAGIEPVRAVVRVVEYPVWRLRYGGQVSDERIDFTGGNGRQQSLGILADLQNQNVFGRAITAGIAGRIERDRQVGSVFTSNGSFFGLPIRSSGFLFSSRQRFVVSEFASRIDERVGLSAEQRWRPFRLSEVIWTYRFQRTHTFDPDPGLLDFFPLDSVTKAARLGVTMFMDRRDDPSVPTTGWFTAANYEQAVRSLGSDFGNVRLLVQHSIFRQLGPAVLAGRAQAASAFGEEALVASERFLLGGATTVRGYGENALGPRDPFGLPGGGDTLLNFNAEARFPVWGWAQGVGFLDAGNIFARRGDLSFADLAVGYGFGLRLATPFAMVRVDFGIPARTLTPDRPANQFKSGRWYFGIGHIF